ncbi:MAG: DctP family TRAP transporter solute-binding subunit [Oscillospiraceae bacterium]|nr:DctP family TRAP transporter solute-binding subunit [Oscillospiraceae bacterium]
MKKILALVMAIAMMLSMAACGSKSEEPKTTETAPATESTDTQTPAAEATYPTMTIRLAHDAPLTTPHHEACENIKAALEERSGGAITVEIYPNQQLGTASEMIESMQMNTIEMVLLPTSKYGGFYPTLNIMDMPFLFPTQESTMKLFQSDLATEMMSGLDGIGIHGLAFYSSGAKNFTNNYEIHKPEDFKGLRIRTQEAPIIMEMYKCWGATTTAIDIMELYNALQNKTVDGQENPFLSISSMKLYEVQNYMIVSGHSYLEYIMACSGQWWDGLDDNTKALIQEVVNENQQFCYDRLQEYNEEYYANIAASDITIYELTTEEKEAFREASEPVYEKFGEEIGTDLLNRVREFLADPANQ